MISSPPQSDINRIISQFHRIYYYYYEYIYFNIINRACEIVRSFLLMGNYANADEELQVVNGSFINADDWTFGDPPWSWQPNYADYDKIDAIDDWIFQANLDTINGNEYIVRFTLADVFFANAPAAGLTVRLSSVEQGLFNTNGDKEITILATDSTYRLSFQTDNAAIGDHLRLDNVSIEPQGNKVLEDLEIQVADEPLLEFFTGVDIPYIQRIALPLDRTNILIGYEV